VLRDLLPNSPKQVSLVLAAGGAGVADSLREHISEGMDPESAVRLVATNLADRTPYDADGCRWVTREFARALGYPISDDSPAAAATTAPGPQAASTPPVMPPAPITSLAADQAETVLPAEPPTAAPPSQRRQRRAPILIAVVVVLGGLVAGAALGHIGPFSAAGGAPLSQLLPDDVSACTGNVNPPPGMTGLKTVLGCNDNRIGGEVFAYQFDNNADYQASLAAFNRAEAFDLSTASSNCPPTNSTDTGVVAWHSTTYPATPGQQLECAYLVVSSASAARQASYLWTAPTENAFFHAVAGSSLTMSSLDKWWSNHAGPYHK